MWMSLGNECKTPPHAASAHYSCRNIHQHEHMMYCPSDCRTASTYKMDCDLDHAHTTTCILEHEHVCTANQTAVPLRCSGWNGIQTVPTHHLHPFTRACGVMALRPPCQSNVHRRASPTYKVERDPNCFDNTTCVLEYEHVPYRVTCCTAPQTDVPPQRTR